MRTKPLISVIIPVYNVQDYLAKCLESIINQTYQNLEIILINDGSTDNSSAIIDQYKKRDNRIVVVNKENEGQGSARNVGLDIMNGEYLSFVDSDDYLALDTFEKNMKIMIEDTGIDMLAFPANLVFNDESERKYHYYPELRVDNYCYQTTNSLFNGIPHLVCMRIYKASIFNDIRFPVGMFYEDTWVLPDVNRNVKRIGRSPYGVYYYYQRELSTMRSQVDLTKLKMRLTTMRRIFDHYYNEMSCEISRKTLYEELHFLRTYRIEVILNNSKFPLIYYFYMLKFMMTGKLSRFFRIDCWKYLLKESN